MACKTYIYYLVLYRKKCHLLVQTKSSTDGTDGHKEVAHLHFFIDLVFNRDLPLLVVSAFPGSHHTLLLSIFFEGFG